MSEGEKTFFLILIGGLIVVALIGLRGLATGKSTPTPSPSVTSVR